MTPQQKTPLRLPNMVGASAEWGRPPLRPLSARNCFEIADLMFEARMHELRRGRILCDFNDDIGEEIE